MGVSPLRRTVALTNTGSLRLGHVSKEASFRCINYLHQSGNTPNMLRMWHSSSIWEIHHLMNELSPPLEEEKVDIYG